MLLQSQIQMFNDTLDNIETRIEEIYQEIEAFKNDSTSIMQQKAIVALSSIIENLHESQ